MSQPFYLRPTSMREALGLLDKWGNRARIMAGGTDLLIAMRRKVITPEVIVDITHLQELNGVHHQDGYITIGALTTHQHICQNTDINNYAQSLVRACRNLGSLQIRNRGTLGGNIGNASPAGDTIPPLFTLEAEIGLQSMKGVRWIGIDKFFTGPGATLRQADEMIIGVRFLPVLNGTKSFFNKIGQRRAVTIAKVSAAGVLIMDGKFVQECRLALGAVAPTVIRLQGVEGILNGKHLSMDLIDEAASLSGELCSPISDIRSSIEYRCTMSRVLVSRGLKTILDEVNDER